MLPNTVLVRTLFAGTLLVASACMDISPPTLIDVDESEFLHSVVLPFRSAVYGVGDSDSVGVSVRMVSGESLSPDPTALRFRITPVQSAVVIDSTGKLKVNDFYSDPRGTGLKLIATYTTGTVTKADTATLYITQKSHDIGTFSITSLDSARGGLMFFTGMITGSSAGLPHFNLTLLTDKGEFPEGVDVVHHLHKFLSSSETGLRTFPVLEFQVFDFANINVNGSAPIGARFWLGLEGYLYGKHVKDSVEFTQMAPAEAGLTVTNDGGTLQVAASGSAISLVQPCANLIGQNVTADTVFLELSDPGPQISCDGVSLESGTVMIPPGSFFGFGIVGKLAYKPGTIITWRAYKKDAPNASIGKGSFDFRGIN